MLKEKVVSNYEELKADIFKFCKKEDLQNLEA